MSVLVCLTGIAMAVTITEVRNALNGISTASVADATIEQKIADGIRILTDLGVVEAKLDPVVRAYAAWQSFLLSKDFYESLKAADLSRKKDAKAQAKLLLDNFAREFSLATGEGFEIDAMAIARTAMFDDRPDDPYTDEATS